MGWKEKVWKYSRLFYVKLSIIISFIFISLLAIIVLVSSYGVFFEPSDYIWLLVGALSFFIIILISYFIVITVNQYKDYFRRKSIISERFTYLTFDDVFKNEKRKKIIERILTEPGIHNNELLRQCNLQKGQLQWHLEVLLEYGIIKKEKLGQYITFFPTFTDKTHEKSLRRLIAKSKTTLEILDLIENNPGINSFSIAKKLNITRSSVKYHIDKLSRKNIISLFRQGREIKLFINQEEIPALNSLSSKRLND
ncbi:MAG: winged helix-turn-helix transcriptional regulator [Candidatus Thorarchaeota archaeon]